MIVTFSGPMAASKTTRAIARFRRYKQLGKKCIAFKYSKDTRYGGINDIVTHDQDREPALGISDLSGYEATALTYEVVLVDEAQFIKQSLPVIRRLSQAGVIVLVTTLNLSSNEDPFPDMMMLEALAIEVNRLTSTCEYCGEAASRTRCTVQKDQVELIGGLDIYKPCCLECFYNPPSEGGSPELSPHSTNEYIAKLINADEIRTVSM